MKKKAAVIGLDGLSWNYLDKLINNGVMPYTKALLNKAFKTELECIPPVTPPSWTSIMTGVNPGKHGIFGFFTYDKSTWKQILTSAYHVGYPRIHEMLSMNGAKSIIFNPMPDYPIIPARNTIQISNLSSHRNPSPTQLKPTRNSLERKTLRKRRRMRRATT